MNRLEKAIADNKELDRLLDNCDKRRLRARDKAFAYPKRGECTKCGHFETFGPRVEVEPYYSKYIKEDKMYDELWALSWEMADYLCGLRMVTAGRPTLAAIRKAGKK